MRLVFIHGWAFDSRFWEALGADLKDFPQTRIELGYFGDEPTQFVAGAEDVLVGHSLGFLLGMKLFNGWRAWVSINSFAFFTRSGDPSSCVNPSQLRALRGHLLKNTTETLCNFYVSLNYKGDRRPLNAHTGRLAQGLDMLRDEDISSLRSLRNSRGLILASRSDSLATEAATLHLAQAAGDAPIFWSSQGGHLLPLTHSQWCAEIIRTNLR